MKTNHVNNTKLMRLFCMLAMLSGSVLGVALGDTVDNNTVNVETTTSSVMRSSLQASDHDEYIINRASGTTTVLVTKDGVAYGFVWSDSHPSLSTMLGSRYKPEYDNAYAKRANADHRELIIDTPRLSVQQFGLPNSKFHGQMYAKDLQP